jgi:hypothetical protein
MPSFGEALSAEEIDRVVAYVRSLCTERSWPRGELNLPRPMATEKAFPEDEAIVTGGGVSRRGERAADMALVYERRFGARNQWELVIPFGVREQPGGGFTRAQVGDIGFALKRAFWHNSASGTILSGLAEVTVPIGDPEVGMGAGTTVFEPALLLGQTLGDNSFVQAQAGLEIGADKTRVEHEAFWRAAFGTTIASGFGRAWSPMVEFLGARPLEGRQPVEWDMIPQIQVSLTKRQHILASVGVRLPMTDRATRPRELLAYVLWDWFDGGLLDGWW